MTLNKFQTTVLSLAGFTALLIGAYLALDPHGFYAAYGIILGHTDLLSEVRGNGTNLAVLGGIMLAGVLQASLRQVAVTCSLIVYFGIASGRTLSILFDGMPSGNILMALGVEIVIGLLCLLAFITVQAKGIERPETVR